MVPVAPGRDHHRRAGDREPLKSKMPVLNWPRGALLALGLNLSRDACDRFAATALTDPLTSLLDLFATTELRPSLVWLSATIGRRSSLRLHRCLWRRRVRSRRRFDYNRRRWLLDVHLRRPVSGGATGKTSSRADAGADADDEDEQLATEQLHIIRAYAGCSRLVN